MPAMRITRASWRARAHGHRGVPRCPELPARMLGGKRHHQAASNSGGVHMDDVRDVRAAKARASIHESHAINEIPGGFQFCRTCGGLARQRIVGLKRPCPGGAASATNTGAIRRVAEGKDPRPQYGEEREQEARTEARRAEGATALLLAIRQRAAGKRTRTAGCQESEPASQMPRRA